MSNPRVEVSREVDAPPHEVYRILSDYQTGHPRILPKPYFSSLVVEEGGVGEGTVILVEMQVMGIRQTLRMHVTEPEPGRVLKEEDRAAGTVTTFTVTPLDGGQRSHVTIATEWQAKGGLAGLAERLINPRVARGIYKKELEILAEVAGAG
jgi:uncharacterized protein YndB with AHSA1/START domain